MFLLNISIFSKNLNYHHIHCFIICHQLHNLANKVLLNLLYYLQMTNILKGRFTQMAFSNLLLVASSHEDRVDLYLFSVLRYLSLRFLPPPKTMYTNAISMLALISENCFLNQSINQSFWL